MRTGRTKTICRRCFIAELTSRHESVIRQRLREARFPETKTLRDAFRDSQDAERERSLPPLPVNRKREIRHLRFRRMPDIGYMAIRSSIPLSSCLPNRPYPPANSSSLRGIHRPAPDKSRIGNSKGV